ncbi:MAG: protein rep, partial [Verrucomicrobiae bacterium]|nr:protein rep [Verrucomicrobiae bacterium]
MYSNVPFVHNEETVRIMAGEPIVGGIPDTGSPSSDESPGTNDSRKDRTRYNRQRCLWMTRAVKQNRLNYRELHEYLEANDVDDYSLAYLMDFRYAINTCCRHALFREHLINGAKEFIGAHTCKNKLCTVCNAKRAKDLRRKYRLFFDKNPDLLHCFDFFHLTLTVPHNESGGFRGKRWYADELMREFNFMRKKQAWKDLVYAGEFGVEVTKNENGLHIHIHSLLLVHKGPQNRN